MNEKADIMKSLLNFVFGMVLGALVGVIGVSLYTPKSGEAVRDDIRNSFEEIKLDYEIGRQKKQEDLEKDLKRRWGEEE